MIVEHGSGVSLADIARRAGVSKGALTHHFPHRRELEKALVRRSNEQFWADVHALVDLSENRPGKLLRAYVRALTAPDSRAAEIFSPSSLLTVLGDRPGMEELVDEDAARWREALSADGFDPAQALVVRLASEGLAMNMGTPYATEHPMPAPAWRRRHGCCARWAPRSGAASRSRGAPRRRRPPSRPGPWRMGPECAAHRSP